MAGLFLDVTFCKEVFVPELVDIVLGAKDVLDGTIKGPGDDMEGTLVELA